MSGVLETLADDAVPLLMFLGLAVMLLGGALGSEVVAVIGLVGLLGGVFVGDTVGEILATYAEEAGEDAAAEDPLETLRGQYARGELSETEFEHRVERLLETEDLDATAGIDDETGVAGDPDRDAERAPERER